MAGVVGLVVGTLMLGAAMALFLCQPEIARTYRRARTRISPAAPVPQGPPIEELARSLRRLRSEVLSPAPGTTMARRRGTTAAYEDLLVAAAHAVGATDTLSGVPAGTDREAERLRLEHVLRQSGLVLD